MHRPSTPDERIEMFGEEILRDYSVIDHDCEDQASLTFIGKSESGGDVFVNSAFYRADLRIATGLVESHFMAGLSGGRKAICPGLVDKRTIEKFHSPAFLESPQAQNLILAGNPCHEESLAIARTVGVDFIVNATLDKDLRPTGVFAGELEAAHAAAGDLVRNYVSVPAKREYDIVLTHGGYVGRNHYQAVKAAYNALPAVRKGGALIVATDNRDMEPIGGPEYRSLLHILKIQGADHYLRMIETPGWRFTKDQWEPEMWAKVFRKIDEEGFVYCTHTIPREDYCLIPGRCGLDFLHEETDQPSAAAVREMVENALRFAVAGFRAKRHRTHGRLHPGRALRDPLSQRDGGENPVNAVIEAEHLRKTFGELVAVDDLSFAVAAGECFGILGPNGAGKTSTIRMVYGFSPLTAGTLSVFGLDVARNARAVKARIGVCQQENNLDPELTVLQNLVVFARYFNIPASRGRRARPELLRFMALDHRENSRAVELSGGMVRRLVMARALLNRPELLILDEPTTGLDPQSRHQVWERLEELRAERALHPADDPLHGGGLPPLRPAAHHGPGKHPRRGEAGRAGPPARRPPRPRGGRARGGPRGVPPGEGMSGTKSFGHRLIIYRRGRERPLPGDQRPVLPGRAAPCGWRRWRTSFLRLTGRELRE